MENSHVLIVTFPGQGNINPSLQFAKTISRFGFKVTLSTSLAAIRRMNKLVSSECLKIIPFSDGYDDGWTTIVGFAEYYSSLVKLGAQNLEKLIISQANEGRPITHVIYSALMAWAAEVSHKHGIRSTLLWLQPATLLDIYYYYYNGYGEIICNGGKGNNYSIELPGLPSLESRDLPSFLQASSPDIYGFILRGLKKDFEMAFEKEESSPPTILVNTFDALEPEALRAIEKLNLLSVGPLIPSAFLDGRDPSDSSFGGDMHRSSGNYVEWLNSKNEGSVVYVAFGSYADLPIEQMEEIARGLLQSRMPFLWVIRKAQNGEKMEEKLSCREELEKGGMIVEWCSQVEVLSHASVGCFVTHCGWNSCLESFACGLPSVGIPQWNDQITNAKLIQDVWKTGIRAVAKEKGIVETEEIIIKLKMVMDGGKRGEEMRRNARKCRDLAVEAAKDGGSSYLNLQAFVAEIEVGDTKKNIVFEKSRDVCFLSTGWPTKYM